MEQLSTRIKALAPSATIAMNQKSQELKAKGVDVINLSVGEPDFPTPVHIREAAKKAIDGNFSHYAPVPGYPDLREAIAMKFRRENNLDYKPSQIVVSTGAKHALANAMICLVDNGDEVIIPAPYWVSYVEQVKIAGGENVILETSVEDDYKLKPEQLRAAITPRTKVLLLCSPSNPTGSVYTGEELRALAEVIAENERVFVIADEIYEHINFSGGHQSIARFESIHDRVVVINGVSKAYAMTGWRIGYLAGPEWLAKACSKLQGQMTSGATSIAQRAALAALTEDQSCVKEMADAFLRRRNLILDHLKEIEGIRYNVPGGAFYVFPDFSHYIGRSVNGKKIENDMDLCLYLLEDAHIATVPGSAFGAEGCVRISYANSDDNLNKAMQRLKDALAGLK
ncbi:MAG: pyridoxal phosphate-dependent aminotransferase [Bacteroidales bacterium]|nr:pyridoxal phosphate-dependent aminotransferase [Bacteroidales bacterium]MBN2697581.1 pyridoxal phosphate-dependent aminotransferase [Bacteroidales bacterium]